MHKFLHQQHELGSNLTGISAGAFPREAWSPVPRKAHGDDLMSILLARGHTSKKAFLHVSDVLSVVLFST
jgi:hypothetical protein